MPKPVDPQKVAKLNQYEYEAILKFAELFGNGKQREEEFPDDLTATAFYVFRKCGRKVSFWDDMLIGALQINSQRKLIQRLRKHFSME